MTTTKFHSVHLIGCGGTGSWLAKPLTDLMLHHSAFNNTSLRLYDKKTVRVHNLERQNFNNSHLGEDKVEALARSLGYPANLTHPSPIEVGEHFHHTLSSLIGVGAQLVILAIDTTYGRNTIIKSLDKYEGDFLCVLPGNEYDTCTCMWYAKRDNVVVPCHPFDIADNYKNPTDKPADGCSQNIPSAPQLITANMASALLSLQVIHSYIEGNPLPTMLNYNLKEFHLQYDGVLKVR